MNDENNKAKLRNKAEQLYLEKKKKGSAGSDKSLEELVQELEIHQIELELQNEELKQSQEKLVDSNIKYFDMYDLAPCGYLTLNENRIINETNFAALHILQIDKHKLIGRGISRFIKDEFQDIFTSIRIKCKKSGTKQSSELKFKRNCEDLWVNLDIKFINDTPNNQNVYFVTITDISKCKQAEQEINNAADMWNNTFDSMSDLVFIMDTEFVFTKVNKAVCDFLKVTQVDLIGKKCFEVLHKSKLPFLCCPMVDALKDEKVHTTEIYDSNIGIPLLVTVSPLFNEKGEMTGSVHLAKDISKYKKIEENFKALFESSSDAIMTIAPPYWTFASGNPAAIKIFRAHDVADFTSRSPWEYSPKFQPDGRLSIDKAKEMIKTTLKNGTNFFTWMHKRLNGEEFPATVLLTSLISGNDNLIQSTVSDITESKRADELIIQNQKIEAVGQLAGGIAHDFNNILMGIYGNISLAKSKLPNDHLALKYLKESELSMERATLLTAQLLTFAKGGDPQKEDVNLAALIEKTVHFDLSGSNVKIDFKQAKDMWRATVDKGQIHQVFTNLTINARQAMPDGGQLYIALENINIPNNMFPGLGQGEYIKCSVKDEGIGIAKANIDSIFNPFFTTKKAGKGLGLASVFSIINKHGGYITVDSKIGKGTTFAIYLPAIKLSQEVHKTIDTDETEYLENEQTQIGRILFMDDEENICNVVVDVLEGYGFSVSTAFDGEKAIELYKQSLDDGESFDAVIMDLTIPGGMGGKDSIKELQKIDPNVKCIVSSGYANDPIMANYGEYGFKAIITKPYPPSKLLEVLNQVLNE